MRAVLVCLVLLLASHVDAQVAFESVTSATPASGTSFTQAHTIGTCANCDLLIAIFADAPALAVSSVTWNTSQSATQLCTAANDETAGALWHLVGPTTGTHNAVITLSSSAVAPRLFIASFSAVYPTSPVGSPICDAYVSSAATSQAHNISGQTNGMGVDFFEITDDAGTITSNGGQTVRSGPTSNGVRSRVLTTKAGATTMNLGYSWVNGFYRWVQMGVGLNTVASGGSCLPTLLGVGKCG